MWTLLLLIVYALGGALMYRHATVMGEAAGKNYPKINRVLIAIVWPVLVAVTIYKGAEAWITAYKDIRR